jgi:hypothetical protein
MPPVNDAPANATLITLPTSFSYDTTGSATGAIYPAFEIWPDVWYRIEPAVDVLIGITVEQTGGPATDGAEVDLYRLIGPDPPVDFDDLEFIDWAGDGTTGPTSDWQDVPSTYRKLSAGEVYFLACEDWNFTDEIVASVTLTTATPIVNDDWEDAIIVNTPGGNQYAVSNSGAELQPGEISFGFHGGGPGGSVWYRIIAQDTGVIQISILNWSGYRTANGYRPRAVVYGPVTYPPANVAAIQASPIVKTLTDSLNQTASPTSAAPYGSSTSWEPLYGEWLATAGQVYYVRVTNNSSWQRTGTFDLRVTLPNWSIFTATSYMSGSTSNVGGWARETQFRDPSDHDEWKGDLDYDASFTISPGLTGDYALEVHARLNYTGGTSQNENFVAVVKVNGVPRRVMRQLEIFTNGTAGYISLTHDYCIGAVGAGDLGTVFARKVLVGFDPGAENAGGPRHLTLAAGDEVTLHFGSTLRAGEGPGAGNPTRYIEVDEIRFSPAGSYGDLMPTGWKAIAAEGEQGFQGNSFVGMPGRSLGDELFIFTDVDPRVIGDTPGATGRKEFTKLGVWRYQLVGGEITAPDGDLNLGASGGELMDIRLFPGGTTYEPYFRDLTILPNGDIYCLWSETQGFAGYLALSKWDGATWTLLSDDVAGLGNPYSGWFIAHLSIDNDGTDIYLTYGSNLNNGVFTFTAGNGYRWHCLKYDVSGDTFTELGTGQTAFPGATRGQHAGEFDNPAFLKVSPGGVPWVIWCERDPDETVPSGAGTGEEYMWVWYWDGAAWVDAEIPHPAVAPPQVANSTYEVGGPPSAPDSKGNYINLLTNENSVYDLVFCHHDGPSETPAVIHSFNWQDTGTIIGGSHPGDTSGLFYAECNGVADWQNDFFAYPGTDWGRDYGDPRLNLATDTYSGNLYLPYLGGWDQGLWLDVYNNRPILYTQSGHFGAGVDGIITLWLTSTGDGWSMMGPGIATETILPDPYAYAWSDFSQPGCTVNGTPVVWWMDPWTFGEGWWLAAWQPGGNVSMNWRSSDRRGAANRVLLG